MNQRVLSSLALWSLILALVAGFGEHMAIWLIAGFAALTQYELYRLLRAANRPIRLRWGLLLGALLPIGTYYGAPFGITLGDVFMIGITVLAIALVLTSDIARAFDKLAMTIVPIILIPYSFAFIVALILLGDLTLGFWCIAVVKCADAGALLTGRAFGRRPLAPTLSPKKTLEGAIGGILTGGGVGLLVMVIGQRWAGNDFLSELGSYTVFISGLLVSIVSIFSDLMQSAIKRQFGVKDSGGVIPGIGGFFDLTDSLLLAAPVAYAIFRVITP